ncbi:virulence-associated E family protein [Burkholderia stagnalis]|uniref:virulence-associated E family protein n=1 Tax=Burkholderia stagnalis TaxID=1503054 RepID=UPI000F5BD7CD|nr:virulence-associated E family protein [Burkholderia stagnalis]RQQ08145.1 hypothetical protein DF164_14750 [Burkholderia stagnalis]
MGRDLNDIATSGGAEAVRLAVANGKHIAKAEPVPDGAMAESHVLAARETARAHKFTRATMHQLLDVLAEDPALCGLVRYDEMKRRVVIVSARPWEVAPSLYWTDTDTTNLRAYIERRYMLTAAKEHAADAVHTYAERNRFHPLREWLNTLKWDGVKRLDAWLATYCGADDTPYVREVGRRFLISAVARVLSPGCKADHMLVLEGPQGIGKSRTVRVLAGDEFYSDAVPDMDDARQTGETVAGVWLLENSEIVGLRKHEADAVKAFLSRSEDAFRPAYGREQIYQPRQFVMVGTCNRDGEGTYLRDETGGRRFWPVMVRACDIAALTADRGQLFAEAVAAFRDGEVWWIEDDAMRAQAAHEVSARTVQNPWLDHVGIYLENRPTVTEVRTADVFLAMTGRTSTSRDATELRYIANALREFGYVSRRLKTGKVWNKGESSEPTA